jgi:hypothetical protein
MIESRQKILKQLRWLWMIVWEKAKCLSSSDPPPKVNSCWCKRVRRGRSRRRWQCVASSSCMCVDENDRAHWKVLCSMKLRGSAYLFASLTSSRDVCRKTLLSQPGVNYVETSKVKFNWRTIKSNCAETIRIGVLIVSQTCVVKTWRVHSM